jgi:hypothetical protein
MTERPELGSHFAALQVMGAAQWLQTFRSIEEGEIVRHIMPTVKDAVKATAVSD